MSAAVLKGMRVAAAAASFVLVLTGASGCTRESLRVALEAQRRADAVEQAVFERQHDAVCVLLYRDALRRLGAAGPLNDEQAAALNAVWNDRDLAEFWAVQHERAKALRVAGVDAKLAAEQSVVDLLWKQTTARADRAQAALAGVVAEELTTKAGFTTKGTKEEE